MSPGRDDDALTWDGDDDPTLDVGAQTIDAPDDAHASNDADAADGEGTDASPTAVVLPEGYTAVGKGSDSLPAPGADSDDRSTDAAAEPGGLGNAALIGIGAFAGIYLLLTLGWLLGAGRLQLVAQLFLEPVAFQITLWLAVAALPLWFATVFWLTMGKRSWLRFTLLAAGALLLIPWPFILAGAFL